VFFNPAASSVLPALVREDELVAANSGIWNRRQEQVDETAQPTIVSDDLQPNGGLDSTTEYRALGSNEPASLKPPTRTRSPGDFHAWSCGWTCTESGSCPRDASRLAAGSSRHLHADDQDEAALLCT
jgi:hypothetical protein